MAELSLIPRGNLGNQMLQYIFALSLQDHVPELRISGYDIPIWNLHSPSSLRLTFLTPSIRITETDGRGVSDLFKNGQLIRAKLRGVPLRCEMFSSPDRFRQVFGVPKDATAVTGPDELLINVRGDEILKAAHSGYGPIPLAWYQHLVKGSGLRPVFLGQLADDYYSNLLRVAFPDARFIPSSGILGDFTAICMAQNIALSVSTFSWLAGWLSNASQIFMPMLGIFNPKQRPDIWMLPLSDTRYRFYEFPVREWQATDAQKTALSSPCQITELPHDKLQSMWHEQERDRVPIRQAALRSLRRKAGLLRVGR